MNRPTLLIGLIGLTLLGAGTAILVKNYYYSGNSKLGVGQPLASSNTEIKVLEEAQSVTASTEKLASTATITAPKEPEKPVPPAIFDKTAAQLGTTLSLLLSTWQQGGPLPRQLAADAATLAENTGQPALEDAASALRASTPREGPTTLNVLLVEVAQALALAPPEDLPADDTAAEAQKSWLRKEFEKLVNIHTAPDTQNRWHTALAAVQMMFARGLVVDGMEALNNAPLAHDARLNPLRAEVKAYISQTGKLNNLITTYTSTFTVNQNGQ